MPTPNDYFAFLDQVIPAIDNASNLDQLKATVYPLLTANLDKLDENLIPVLQTWSAAKFSDTEERTEVARKIRGFSSVIDEFPQGDKATLIEIAIAGYQIAGTVLTHQDFPTDWASTQNNLGTAYGKRQQGDDLEKAIQCYQQALQVYTRQDFPTDWANTQNNLGTAYSKRQQGDDLETAIQCYQQALHVYTRQDFPTDWAWTQHNLGTAYDKRQQGDDLETAIQCYQQALEVYTRQDFPTDWARTQNNLGAAYSKRQQGDDLETAIQCYQQALEVYTRQDFPTDWARTQHNLGTAYGKRQQGDDLETAIQCYQQALLVRTRQDLPLDYIMTQSNLGLAYQYLKNLPSASTCFAEAIDTLEFLLRQTHSAEARRYLAEKWEKLYNEMIDTCLTIGEGKTWFYDPEYKYKALDYVERSKACNFPYFTQTESLPSLSRLQSLLNGLDEQTAIVEWFINMASKTIQVFIVRKGGKISVASSKKGETTSLVTSGHHYLQTYQDLQQAPVTSAEWEARMLPHFKDLSKSIHLDDIVADLKQTSTCTRLILIPHCFMHLFPLHLLPLAKDQTLLDEFNTVQYAPSLQLLHHLSTRSRPDFNRLVAIENPTQDLAFTEVEVAALRTPFHPTDTVYRHQAARKDQIDFQHLSQTHCLHWAGHGYFDQKTPAHSGLVCADAFLTTPTDPARHRRTPRGDYLDFDKCLTLPDIFTLPLHQCRLVTLSACETGWIDPKSSTDEYIGLPSGFLYAGATNVVNSLWQVNDLSTAWLMIKFYQNYHQDPTSVAKALNEAQKWLREVTKKELWEWLTTSQITLTLNQEAELKDNLYRYREDDQPYQGVYYWGGFCAVGR